MKKAPKKTNVSNGKKNKGKKSKWDAQTVGRIFQLMKGHRWEFWSALFCAVLASGIQLLAPIGMGRAIDQIAGAGQVNFPVLARWCIALLVAYGAGSLLQWLVSLMSNRLAQRTIEDLRGRAFDRLSQLPLRYYDTHIHGDILSRLTNDIDAVADGLQQTVLQLLMGIVIVTGTLLIMFVFNPLIALGVVLVTLLAVWIARFIASRSSKMFRKQSNAVGALNGLAEEMIAGHREVLLYGMASTIQDTFEEKDQQLYRVGQAAQFYSSLVNPCTRFVNNVAYVFVGMAAGTMALMGKMSVGQIAAMLNFATQFARPINEVSSVATQLQAAMASARRIFALIDEEREDPETDKPSLATACGEVAFSHVDFSYSEQEPLIEDLTIDVKRGQTIAIVGPSGAGKTTLVNLLMRFYEVDDGTIRIDGTDIASVTRDSVRQNFAMVLQDSWLFSGTVRDNIAYGLPGASEEEIIQTAREVRADGFIRRLPNGYDTALEENGGNISQGERQLLSVARALLSKPPILILDEATSSVDTRTELVVRKAFNRAMQGRTSFVIAHRLSTIEDADLIVVMNAGKIVEQGSHAQLLAMDGFYKRLYESQFVQS